VVINFLKLKNLGFNLSHFTNSGGSPMPSTITVEGFFDQYVFKWMFSDIENCIKAKANFAVAALLMTYTENIGSLIEGNLGLSGTSESDFNKFLEYFDFNDDPFYYKIFKITYHDPNPPKITTANIYRAFRCGLIHEYAPKIPCVVENHSDRVDHYEKNDPGIGWVYPPQDYDISNSSGYVPLKAGKPYLRFHTNAFYRDFKKAVEKIYKKINAKDSEVIHHKSQISIARVLSRKLIIPQFSG
jgi:hypothetical protein